jgi:hypothetical protein
MKPFRATVVALVITGLSVAIPAASQAADQARINEAVDKARQFLIKSRTGNAWMNDGGDPSYSVGLTALCTVALVEAGVPRSDPMISSSARFVRDKLQTFKEKTMKSNYAICISVVMLDKIYQDAEASGLIKQLTVRIAAAQNQKYGGWGYECPPLSAQEYAQWSKFLEDNQSKSLPENAPSNLGQGGFGYCDNSNTQFAILALWVGRRHGVKVNYPLFLAERRFRKSQHANTGGWNYGAESGANIIDTPAMTAAGLLALALGFSSSKETSVTIVRGGSKLETSGSGQGDNGRTIKTEEASLDKDPQVMQAQKFIIDYLRNCPVDRLPYLYYFLWSLERVCVTYGWDKDMAGFDWYGFGCDVLINKQSKDGGFGNNEGPGIVAEVSPIAETAFAVLFLKRADLIPDAGKLVQKVRSDKFNQTDKKTVNKKTAPGEKTVAEKTEATPPEKSAEQLQFEEDTKQAQKWMHAVVNGGGLNQEQALKNLRDTKGKAYTLAMVDAIKKIGGGALQNQVRDALAERLTRQSANSLSNYLQGNEIELKSAAAWAAATKSPPCKEVIPDIIPLLNEADTMVSDKALEALKILSGGEDYGKSAEKWNNWWKKTAKPPSAK